MAISEAKKWIDSKERDFEEGRLLYERFGKSRFLKNMFSSGEDEYNSIRLLTELKNIVSKTPHAMEHRPASPENKAEAAPENNDLSDEHSYKVFSDKKMPDIDVKALPEDLQKLVIEKGSLYREACSLHAKLELFKTDAERKVAAERISINFIRIAEIWREMDYYHLYKIRRPKDGMDFSKLSTVKLIMRRNTVRTSVSKHKKKGASPELARFQEELNSIDFIIKSRENDED